MIDLFILMFFGAIVGWLISKPRYNRRWDIAMGTIGALASSSLVSAFGRSGATGYNGYSFIIAMVGAVLVIYIGRSLERFPQN